MALSMIQTSAGRRQALLNIWMEVIGDETGYPKGEINALIKQRKLLDLMLSYPEHYPDVTKSHVRFSALGNSALDAARAALAAHLRAADLTDEHFTEYLVEIESFAGDMGIQLPRPGDLYPALMGRADA